MCLAVTIIIKDALTCLCRGPVVLKNMQKSILVVAEAKVVSISLGDGNLAVNFVIVELGISGD
jgi:hypothetical protein